MKTMAVEIERRQTLRFFVSVPDHWSRNLARVAMTPPVIDEITENADDFDWKESETDFKVVGLYELVGQDEAIDYAFPDEPAPPHPDQLALIPAQEVAGITNRQANPIDYTFSASENAP